MANTKNLRGSASPHNQRPDRALRPDETFCWACGEYFLDGELFERHRPAGHCIEPSSLGWVRDTKGSWGYRVSSKASTNRPRRTHAQVALDRLIAKLPDRQRSDLNTIADIEKVVRVLERDRDSR